MFNLTHSESGLTLYATIERQSDGYIWNTATHVLEAFAAIANHTIALAEAPLYRYCAALPAAPTLPDDLYLVKLFQQAGGAPALGDPFLSAAEIDIVDGVELNLGEQLAAIRAKTDTFGAGAATFVSPIVQGGSFNIEQGRDYLADDGWPVAFLLHWVGPSLVGATAQMLMIPTTSYNSGATPTALTATTAITASGDKWLLSTEFAAAVTTALVGGPPSGSLNYTWEIVATLADTHKVTLMSGKATVIRKVG